MIHNVDHNCPLIGRPFVNASNIGRMVNANASSMMDTVAPTLAPTVTMQVNPTTTAMKCLSGYAVTATTSKPPKSNNANKSSTKRDSCTPRNAANTYKNASE